MKFNPESPFFKFISTFVQFILLNICYLIVCIPIITIGAATSSLFSVTLRYADDEKGYLLIDFFKKTKEDWLFSTLSFLCFIVPILALGYSGIFWIKLNSSIITMLIGLFSLAIAFYLLLALLYCLVLVGRFDASFKQTIQNALFLPIVEPIRSTIFSVIIITLVALLAIVPAFQLIWLFFGFSFTSYCFAFLFLKTFKKYEV